MANLLDDMNTSELLLLAADLVPNVHRGMARDTLYEIILGAEPELPQRQIDKVRLRIMEFIDENFTQVEPLVQGCPAKTRDLRACFRCTDIQVAECALSNPIIFGNNSSEKKEEGV